MSVARRGTTLPNYESMLVKAGILESATYPEQMLRDASTGKEIPDARAGMHVATIAAALNYGTESVPPRPFMNETIAREKKAWANGVVKLIRSGMPFATALATIGQVMKEDIQTTINDWPADNSDKWAAFKGFNKGLTFTSHLLNSVEFALEDKS